MIFVVNLSVRVIIQGRLISKSLLVYSIKLIYENIEMAYLKGDDINASI